MTRLALLLFILILKISGNNTNDPFVIKKTFNIYVPIGGEITIEEEIPVVLVGKYITTSFFSNIAAFLSRDALWVIQGENPVGLRYEND